MNVTKYVPLYVMSLRPNITPVRSAVGSSFLKNAIWAVISSLHPACLFVSNVICAIEFPLRVGPFLVDDR